MDVSILEPEVCKYFQLGLAPATRKMYAAAMKRFTSFCTKYNIGEPFPVSEKSLCSFAAHLAEEGLAPQTCKSYLAAVRNTQLSLGLPDPREQSSLPVLKRVLTGISRAKRPNAKPPRIRLPNTFRLLEKIHHFLMGSSNAEKIVIWAVACTAFFGFFRLGELLPMSDPTGSVPKGIAWGDVALDNRVHPSMIQIHLTTSKCDQAGKGVDTMVGLTDHTVCPVTAILDYIEVRSSRPGPFFQTTNGKAVTKPRFVQHIRETLQSMGFPQEDFAGHSFRIGAATTAALCGVEDSTIQTLGRWKSSAFSRYVRIPKTKLAALSKSLTH